MRQHVCGVCTLGVVRWAQVAAEAKDEEARLFMALLSSRFKSLHMALLAQVCVCRCGCGWVVGVALKGCC